MSSRGRRPRPSSRLTPAELWSREEKRARRERWERLLDQHVAASGLPAGVPEYKFHPSRGWLFDRAWPDFMVAAEVEGVLGGAGGRHQRAAGFSKDCEKYNAAALAGWLVLRFTPRQVRSGVAVRALETALARARSSENR